MYRRFVSVLLLVLPAVVLADPPGTLKGPSSSESPYLLPVAPGVTLTSILTAGDAADNGYRLVGNPDGIGFHWAPDGNFVVTFNHELQAGTGVPRTHGGDGAFVSRWLVRRSDLRVLAGRDLVRNPDRANTWDAVMSAWVSGAATISRLCSADLAAWSAYWHEASGTGVRNAAIHLAGEEAGAEGRVFAFVDGERSVWELPSLGRMSVENAVASPFPQRSTIVAVTDDSSVQGQVYIYVGTKQSTGNQVQRAGLHGGRLYALKVSGNQDEGTGDLPFGAAHDGSFTLVDVTPTAYGPGSGAALNAASVAAGATNFRRPEDAAWQAWRHPDSLLFSTTSSVAGRSRIWRLSFTDIRHPELGGTIAVAGDGGLGGTAFQMADNLTVDTRSGKVVFVEDVGNNERLGKVWALDPDNGGLTELAAHDPSRFSTGGTAFLTRDEEASGIVDVSWVFRGVPGYDTGAYRYFLVNTMAHYPHADPAIVAGGQLMLMTVPLSLLP